MNTPQITNRKGPNCELTVRIKFAELDRFRSTYREQLSEGYYFIRSNRSKPEGTRLQIIFILEDHQNLEIWSWGVIEQIVSAQDAASSGGSPGLRVKLMDMTRPRKKQIEQLFSTDEAVQAIQERHQSSGPTDARNPVYSQVNRSARQEQIASLDRFLQLATTADHYALLGVARDAKDADIRSAFRDRTRKYHPDQHFRKIPEELQQRLATTYQKIQDAYRTLLDPKRRAMYDTSIGNYANPEVQRRAQPHVRMQEKFKEVYKELIGPRADLIRGLLKEADEAISMKDYRAARSKLKLASVYDPLNRRLKKRIAEIEALLPSSD